jgi:CheY-like chemotaxis protein
VSPDEHESETRAHTVLVAEDDVDARRAVAGVLRDAGYTVIEAANGAEALQQAQAHRDVDLIVLDMMMPVMDGWQFLAARMRDPQLRRTPTIVLSGVPVVDPACLDLPVTAYCGKPFQFDYLAALVHGILAAN